MSRVGAGWRALPLGWRIVTVVVGLIVTANVVAAAVDRSIGGSGEPGGPSSSSYATGPDGLAAVAELLAWDGHDVRRIRGGLDEAALDPRGTLVLADVGPLDQAERAAVVSFVRAGGRLVTTGPGASPVLRRLVSPDPVWTAEGEERGRVLARVPETAAVTNVRSDGLGSWREPGALRPALGRGDVVTGLVGDAGGGRIVALADPSLLHNRHLDQVDNAALALSVVGGPFRPVQFAEGPHGYGEATGLGALPSSWRWAMAAALVALAALYWSYGKRFGPPDRPGRDLPPPRRDDVDALATTLWRTGRPEEALAPVRDAVRSHPDPDVAATADRPLAEDDDVLALGRALTRATR